MDGACASIKLQFLQRGLPLIQKRRIAGALLIGFIAEAFNKVFPLLLVRHAASTIGVDAFGEAQLAISIVELAIPLIIFGYPTLAAIELGQTASPLLKTPNLSPGHLVAGITFLKLAHAIAVTAGLALVLPHLGDLSRLTPLVMSLCFVLFTSALDMSYVQIAKQKVRLTSLLMIGAKIAGYIAILWMVHAPSDLGLFAFLTLGTNALVSIGSVAVALRNVKWSWPRWNVLKEVAKQSRAFALTIPLLLIFDRIDLLLFDRFADPAQIGLYAGSSRLVQALTPLIAMIAGVFFSEIVGNPSRPSLTSHTRLACWASCAIAVPAAFGGTLLAPQLLGELFGASFAGGAQFFQVQVFQSLAQVALAVFGLNVLLIQRKAFRFNMLLAMGIAISIVLALVLGARLGGVGVALAFTIGKSVAGLGAIVLAHKYLEQLPWKEFFQPVLAGFLMVLGLLLLPTKALGLNILVGGLVFGAALFAMNRNQIMQALRQVKNRLP